jgi:hypothetical protein
VFPQRYTRLNIIIVPLTLFPLCLLLLVRLHCELCSFYFYRLTRETDRFLTGSGVKLPLTNFHFHRTAFSSHLKSKVGKHPRQGYSTTDTRVFEKTFEMSESPARGDSLEKGRTQNGNLHTTEWTPRGKTKS